MRSTKNQRWYIAQLRTSGKQYGICLDRGNVQERNISDIVLAKTCVGNGKLHIAKVIVKC